MTFKEVVDVLIVDDEEAIALAELLRTLGYSVKVAADGEVALRLLEYVDVGVILLDIEVRTGKGMTLLEGLHSAIPVVAVSSDAGLDDDEMGGIGSKVVAQLQKPVDPHHLVRIVAETLGHF